MEGTPDDEAHEKMKEMFPEVSAAVGSLIGLGEKLMGTDNRHYIVEKIMPFVGEVLAGAPHRVQRCYSLVLSAARLV